MIYMRNITITTAKSATYLENVGLGISLNLLLTLVPGVTWVEFVPVGLATTIGFMLLGWVFDAVQNPNPARGTIIPRGGRFRAFVGLVAVLASINAIAALVELVFDLPIRAAILIVVPIFAFLWAIVAGKPELPAHSSMAELGRQSLSRFPEVANEICIMTCVGYLGLLIASLVPSELVSEFARTAHLQNGFLAAALCSLVLTASLVGINPFITATILVTSVVDAGLQIHPILLIISLQIGWSLTLILSPVTSTIAIISGIVGQSATTVGIKWDGLYSATILTIALAIFLGLIGP